MKDKADVFDELSRAFEPIEMLFYVYCRVDARTFGILPQYCGVVGERLAKNFKDKMAELLGGTENDLK